MMRNAGSYAVTVMGFIIGSAGGGLLGFFVSQYLPNGGSIAGMLGILLLSGVVGAIIGSVIVVWGLLRACTYPAAGATALVVAVGWLLIGGIMLSLEGMGETVLWLLPLVIIGVCCGARGIVVAITSA